MDPLLKPRSQPHGSRVLLDCANPLMADGVLRAFASVAECADGATSQTSSGIVAEITRFPGRTQTHLDEAQRLGCRWTPRWLARWRTWDVILLADHAPLRYVPSARKLLMPHGPGPHPPGKGARGHETPSYYYDARRCCWPDDTPVYDVILDTSEAAARIGRDLLPSSYASRIVVVGDLRADELVRAASRADGAEDDPVPRLAVMSTWGASGLMAVHGEWLLEALTAMMDAGLCKVTLTMHENLWRPGPGSWATRVSSMRHQRLRVVARGEDWVPALAATDMALCDHTSLGTIYSVLRRPMIPVSTPGAAIHGGSVFAWLQANSRPVTDPSTLRHAVARADQDYSTVAAPPVIDHLGSSRARTAAAVRTLLTPRSAP